MSKRLVETNQAEADDKNMARLSRRKFLGYASAATGLMVAASACNKEPVMVDNTVTSINGEVDLGTGDFGILNYAYALEQLEAAFYIKVVMSMYPGGSPMEAALIKDVRDHEIAHREFFKNALGGMAIPALDFDFSSINFSSRTSVLATSKAFEDLGVSAYNGAGRLLKSPDYLVLAGKIVSVEARHAAYFRELIMMNSFADDSVVDAMGLDVTRKPMEVLAIAGTYIKTKINASNLPTY